MIVVALRFRADGVFQLRMALLPTDVPLLHRSPQVREQEQREKQQERHQKQRKVRAWLEEQQATINQQVKKGGNLLTGGGSGVKRMRLAPGPV